MAPAGFEPAIPASERPQTHTLDRTALGVYIYIYVQDTLRCPLTLYLYDYFESYNKEGLFAYTLLTYWSF
jgi:hypothetical protein